VNTTPNFPDDTGPAQGGVVEETLEKTQDGNSPKPSDRDTPDRLTTKSKWPENPVWSLERLWAEGAKPTRWIVEPLIAEGHQVLLAGEPKSGKSLLAAQLCLEIAKGTGHLLQISLPGISASLDPKKKLPPGAFRVAEKSGVRSRPRKIKRSDEDKWKVLYVSFEMNPEVMWARTSQHATGMRTQLLLPQPPPGTRKAPKLDEHAPNSATYQPGTFPSAHGFYHLFDLEGQRDLGLVPRFRVGEIPADLHKKATVLQEELSKILEALQPDLVVLDSLSKLHWADENSNVEMRDVLQALRELCTVPIGPAPQDPEKDQRPRRYIAHLIIHHTRKDSGDQKFMRKGASEMRGASAIHAEADLAITITKRKQNGSEISLSFSSRHSAVLPDLRLVRDEIHGTYSGQMPPESTSLIIARRLYPILDKRRHLKAEEIMELYRKEKIRRRFNEPELQISSWEKLLNRLYGCGALLRVKGKRGIPNSFKLRRTVTEANWPGLVMLAESKGKGVTQKAGKSA
jgi:hypothetical protein